jgi:L-seryl-tRNA(Ser) seleniumtransferase
VGRRVLVEACRRSPIARAVRADKLTLAALEATALAHARGDAGGIPAVRSIGVPTDELRARAQRLVAALPAGAAELESGRSVTGGGSLPGGTLATVLVALRHPRPELVAEALRAGEPPVVARIESSRLVLDVRTVDPAEDETLAAALRAAVAAGLG